MYHLLIYSEETSNNVEVLLLSMQQVLDLLTLLNLSMNTDLWVQLYYERRADCKHDEIKPHG